MSERCRIPLEKKSSACSWCALWRGRRDHKASRSVTNDNFLRIPRTLHILIEETHSGLADSRYSMFRNLRYRSMEMFFKRLKLFLHIIYLQEYRISSMCKYWLIMNIVKSLYTLHFYGWIYKLETSFGAHMVLNSVYLYFHSCVPNEGYIKYHNRLWWVRDVNLVLNYYKIFLQ